MLEAGTATHSYVQIPLWTIVTLLRGRKTNPEQERSDSSMDDCNPAHNFFDSRLSLRSDSSMDDCNADVVFAGILSTVFRFLYGRL